MPIIGAQGSTKGPATAPTIGTATAGNTSASVTFTAPSFSKLPITSYTVTSSPGSFTGTGASSPITVSGLSNDTPYTFTVRATSSNGTSAASSASNSVSPGLSWSAWTLTTLDSARNFPHIGFGNGLFMATEYNVPGSPAGNYGMGFVWSSSNGTTWTRRTLPSVQQWKQAMYAAGIWNIVCGGSGDFATSTDGATWTARFDANLGNEWVTMASSSRFVAASYGSATAVYSTNGTSWTTSTMSGALTWAHGVYATACSLFMAMTGTTTYNTSPDGVTWTSRTLPSGVGYGIGENGTVVLVVNPGSTQAYTSTNGINWTSRTLPANAGQCIVYSPSGGQFIMVQEGSTTAYTSPDGVTWTSRTLPSETFNSYRPSLASGSIYVTGASNGKIATITAT